jgi:hypothetical protein
VSYAHQRVAHIDDFERRRGKRAMKEEYGLTSQLSRSIKSFIILQDDGREGFH